MLSAYYKSVKNIYTEKFTNKLIKAVNRLFFILLIQTVNYLQIWDILNYFSSFPSMQLLQ
jgi:hypothetical protein